MGLGLRRYLGNFSFFSRHWHSLDLKFYITGFHGHIWTFLTGFMDHWMMSRPCGLCADSMDFGVLFSCADCCGNCYSVGTLELLLL